MEQKILTLAEKWEIDAQAYREGASARTLSPQCEKCRYNIIGDAILVEFPMSNITPSGVNIPSL